MVKIGPQRSTMVNTVITVQKGQKRIKKNEKKGETKINKIKKKTVKRSKTVENGQKWSLTLKKS